MNYVRYVKFNQSQHPDCYERVQNISEDNSWTISHFICSCLLLFLPLTDLLKCNAPQSFIEPTHSCKMHTYNGLTRWTEIALLVVVFGSLPLLWKKSHYIYYRLKIHKKWDGTILSPQLKPQKIHFLRKREHFWNS